MLKYFSNLISHSLSCKFIAVISTRRIPNPNTYLDNGVMKTPKRRFTSLLFTCLCITRFLSARVVIIILTSSSSLLLSLLLLLFSLLLYTRLSFSFDYWQACMANMAPLFLTKRYQAKSYPANQSRGNQGGLGQGQCFLIFRGRDWKNASSFRNI